MIYYDKEIPKITELEMMLTSPELNSDQRQAIRKQIWEIQDIHNHFSK